MSVAVCIQKYILILYIKKVTCNFSQCLLAC